jgi:hypothetical protein
MLTTLEQAASLQTMKVHKGIIPNYSNFGMITTLEHVPRTPENTTTVWLFSRANQEHPSRSTRNGRYPSPKIASYSDHQS